VEPLLGAMMKRKLLLLELFLHGWVSHFYCSVVFLYRKKNYIPTINVWISEFMTTI
jgi:hypothetical protein